MDDQPVIGPLNLRQFLMLSGGLGFAYLSYRFVGSYALPFIIIIGYVVFVQMKRFSSPPITELYLRTKRDEFGNPLDYTNWLNMKIATVKAQINERERKGFVVDPSLTESQKLLEEALKEVAG